MAHHKMKTLQEDIDDLDRMVDGGAPKDAIRSQIRLIAREVAALQADFASLDQHHSQFREAAERAISHFHERDKKEMRDLLEKQAQKHAEIRKAHTLKRT